MFGFFRMAFILLLAVLAVHTIAHVLRERRAHRAWQRRRDADIIAARRAGGNGDYGDMANGYVGTMAGSDWAPDTPPPAFAGGAGGSFDGGGASGDWSGTSDGGGGGGDGGGGGGGGGGGDGGGGDGGGGGGD